MSVLDAFLKADTNLENDVYIKRLDTHIRIKAIGDEKFDELKEQATHFTGTGKNRESVFKEDEFTNLLLIESCVNIDFGDSKLMEKHGVKSAEACLRKALLTGEILRLQSAILSLNGFDDDSELFDEAKN
ncbi:phage tail assembly chaperone [Cytobacillus massiliigabonensis]|uniref:phage tail assembly chaperone n=1 Tax=Cytobacillus massiliigabonensis TaxID=1871011 RepID=UPI0015E14DF2|nr:hypothetical protein [Cytobacillus massiliigabonensis]